MNTNYTNMFKGSNKIVAVLILSLCLLLPMVVAGQDNDTEPIDQTLSSGYKLKIYKAVDSVIAAPGSVIKYTIRVENKSDSDVENVLVEDRIPPYTTYVQGSASNYGVYSSDDDQIDWKIDRLEAGNTIEISYEVQIDLDTRLFTKIYNTAKITQPRHALSNQVITVVKEDIESKLDIIKQVDKTTAFAADTLHYTLIISNNGDAKVYYTEIVDDIPEFTTYILGSATDANYDANFNRLSWNIEYLWPGESVDLQFSAIIDSDIPAYSQITNIGTIILEEDNKSDTVVTTVPPFDKPRMFIEKRVDKATAYSGDTLTYELIVFNGGEIDAENVAVFDKIPQHATFVAGSSANGIYDAGSDRLDWLIGIIEPNQNVRLGFKVVIDFRIPGNTTIVNKATVTAPGQPDSDLARTKVLAYTGPRIEIDKSVDKSSAYPGDTLTYSLMLENIGADAENVIFEDILPEFTVYVDGSASDGTYDPSNNKLSWTIDEISSSQSVTLTFKAIIENNVPTPSTIINIGKVLSPGPPDSDEARTQVLAYSGPRIQIDKSVDKSSAYPGDLLIYNLVIKNVGFDAKNVFVTDVIPEYTTYIEGSADGASYNQANNQLSWTIDELLTSQSITLTFSVLIDDQIPTPSTIVNVGEVTSPGPPDSDEARTDVTVSPEPRVFIDKSVSKSSAYNGDTLTYYLDISNYGGEAADNVDVIDNIPEHTTYIPGSATGGSYDANLNRLTWNLPAVPQGTDVTMLRFEVVIDIQLTTATTIINVGTVTYEDRSDSDDATTEVSVHPEPRLFINKSVSKSSALPGDTLTYYLDISNYGGEAADNVDVIDNIPEHTTYIPGSATGGSYDANLNRLTWNLSTVPQGTDVTMLRFDVVIDNPMLVATTVINVGEVSYADQYDSDEARTEVTASLEPRLYIDKSVDKLLAFPGDTLTYSLIIENVGVDAEDVTVADVIPEFTTYIDGSASGGSFDPSNNQLSWTIDEILTSQNVTLDFKVVIDDRIPTPSTILNVGTVNSPGPPDSDEARTEVSASPEPRLYIDKRVDKSSAYSGDTLTYELIIWNGSDVNAENINVIDNIPSHTIYVPGSAIGGNYDAGLNQISWTIDGLEPDQERYLSFRAIIEAGTAGQTVINNVGTITSPGLPDSDEARTNVQAYSGPELIIEKRVDKAYANAGDTLTYTLIVSNLSATTAENVNVEDYIPEFTRYVPGSAFGGEYNPGSKLLTWTVDYIEARNPAYLSFRVVINKNVSGYTGIINTGSVVLPDKKISDDAKTTVLPSPTSELEIDKRVDKVTAYVGDTLTYSLDITNIGLETARNINVEDYIPDYTTYVLGSASFANFNSNMNLLNWQIDYIEPGMTERRSFKVVIDLEAPDQTEINNTGSIVLPGGNISDNATTTVIAIPEPVLEINKTVDKATAFAGDTLTYTLVASNIGELSVVNVEVEDFIPGYTTYIPASNSDLTYDAGNKRLSWLIENLDQGATSSTTFKVIIDETTPVQTAIINIGTIISHGDPKPDTAKTIVRELSAPQLDISKVVDLATAYAGDILTYTISISNSGNVADEDVWVSDPIPQHLTYVDGSVTGGGDYNSQTGTIGWNISVPAGGSSPDLTFKVQIDESTPAQTEIENIGSILFPDDSKISDTAKTTVQEKLFPRLDISKVVDLSTAYASETLTYTIKVVNQGEVDAEAVHISDNIPQNVTYVSGSVTNSGTFDAQLNKIDWTVDIPAGGSSPDMTFKVSINNGTPDQTLIRNIGSILYPDATIQSDTALTTVQAGPSPYLNITKDVDKPTAYEGDTLTYTISVSNSGNAADEAVWVTDLIPQYLTYVDGSVSGNGVYDAQAGIVDWNISVPAGGTSPELTFKVTIDEATPAQTELENIGSILFPDDSKLSDAAKTVVLETIVPNMEITKQVDSLIASPGSVLTYSLEFTNTGNTPITQITAWDKLPEFTSYVLGSATAGGTYDANDKQVRWNWQVGSIAPGHSIDLSFKVRIDGGVNQGTQITNIGSAALPIEQFIARKLSGVQFETLDTVHSNSVTTIIDIKTGENDLTIFKEVSDTYTAPGNILDYDLTISNSGDATLNNIVFVDTIPIFTTYVPGSATGGAIYDGTDGSLIWTIGSLEPNGSEKYRFSARVDAEAPNEGVIFNQAFIIEPTTIHGNIVMSTVMRGQMLVTKSVDKTQATIGDTLTYSISYTNTSMADVDNFIIADTLPEGLNYIAGSASTYGLYNPINNTIAWRIPIVPAGSSGLVSFRVEIDESATNSGEIENFVIFSGENIPVDTSNQVIVTVTSPQMVMSKTVDQAIALSGDTLTYTINALNDGSSPLNDAELIDTLPDNFEYVSGTATVNGTAVTVTGTDILSIPVGTMDVAETAEIIYDVAIMPDVDESIPHVNSAILRGTNNSGATLEFGPVRAIVSLQSPRLRITKRAEVASSIAGGFVPFEITITNMAIIAIEDVVVTDSMSSGFFYVEGSSTIDGIALSDPVGTNPYEWFIGNMAPGQTVTLHYISQAGISVPAGLAISTAWAAGRVGGEPVRTTNVIARVNVITTNIPGAIRGKIIVDCDSDGKADIDSGPAGIDLYLDDGSHSQVNEKGMFYFSTVRAGEHLVALDIRDLKNYELAEGQDGSVLVYVHEAGESYVTFRICPAYPKLSIIKEAAVLPKIKITKTANLSDSMITDSNMVIINYDILIESGPGVRGGEVVVVDSLPSEALMIVFEGETRHLTDTDKVIRYVIDSPGQKRLTQSVYYSLDDLDFETDYFLTSFLYLELVVNAGSPESSMVKSEPLELSIGPFSSVSTGEVDLKMTAAHFITAKAYLQENDLPLIASLADSISRYPDVNVKVEGHADYRKIHNKEFPSNWELSAARAKSVVDRFTGFHSLDSSKFKYEGFAATRPIDSGKTEAAWQKNRRTEVILSGYIQGGIRFGGNLNQLWSKSTMLELEPLQWDTLLVASGPESKTDLINSWEVLISISNIGPGKANQVVIEDLLPIGAVFEEGSVTVNGRKVSGKVDVDNNLIIGSGDIPEGGRIEIRYHIRAAKESSIIGGGKAVVKIQHRDIGVVKQESNPIRFY